VNIHFDKWYYQFMKLLSEEKYPTETLILVPISRLSEEYKAGKDKQIADEHWRKNVRLVISFCLTMIPILIIMFGENGGNFLYISLFLHFFVHVIL